MAGYYNGDIGTVLEIVKEGLLVEIRGQKITITRDIMDDVKLAYSISIHKSQGSEFPTVIVVLPMQPSVMLVRNLLYTAITRAKKKVIIISEGSALETAIRVDRSKERRTLLNSYLPAK